MEEVQRRDGGDSGAWIVVGDSVYDVTNFADEHPGGKSTILKEAGKDATKKFEMFHDPTVLEAHSHLKIGTLSSSPSSPSPSSSSPKEDGAPHFQPTFESLNLQPSSTQSWNSGGTAGMLDEERSHASFETELMTDVLCGGQEGTKRRRFIMGPLKGIDNSDKYNMTRSEQMSKHLEDFIGMHKPYIESGFIPRRDEVGWMSEVATNSGPLMTHMGLFLPTIIGQASLEQQGWWLYRCLTFQIVGSYAQTELGHGSNVRGLQTVSDYDPATEEFVLNTPTLQSMKWWNSDIGCTATHATVYAQLRINGKEFGVHVFMLQVRDENHMPLPGIEIGDCGNKMGENGMDTGYMRLKDVRIPRQHMLEKRQHVDPDGTYVKHSKGGGSDKLHYLTMMSARAGMVAIGGGKLSIASTIAARYSCVRQQGFVEGEDGTEAKIMDYQFQQYRIMKQIAIGYAIKFSGRWLQRKYDEVSGKADAGEVPDDIVETHASVAGLKGLVTKLVSDGIEDCRKCCGGHGYSLDSGIAALSVDYAWQATAEGDFVVMLLQTARFLLKCVAQARRGMSVPGFANYLSLYEDSNFSPSLPAFVASRPSVTKIEDCFDLNRLLALFRHRAVVLVGEAEERIRHESFASSSLYLVAAARAHCYYFLMSTFHDTITNFKAELPRGETLDGKDYVIQTLDPKIKIVLERLFCLTCCINIIEGEGWGGLLPRKEITIIEAAVSRLLSLLRPETVALVDAFDFPDNVLNSTLGRSDGNVYEACYQAAVRCRLNREVPFAGYKDHLRPNLDLELLAVRNGILPEAKL